VLGDGVIRLRAPRPDDAHAIAEGCSDAAVARWTKVPSPYTLEDARTWIAIAARVRAAGTELPLVIVREGEDRVVGCVALRPRVGPEPHGEVGYWVSAAVRRGGLGTRAVRLVTAHALDRLGLRWIEITVSPRNAASLALARSAGFTAQGRELREFKGAMEEFEILRRSREGEKG
jgi:RimJ/RimL family protein N-acetyltransferase